MDAHLPSLLSSLEVLRSIGQLPHLGPPCSHGLLHGLHDVHILLPPDMLSTCLQELPRGRYLSTLTVLDLEGNSFLAIPEVLRHARQLTHLDLSCNHGLQVGLPDVHTLLQLQTLRILDLSKVSERPPHEAPPLPNEVTLAAAFKTVHAQAAAALCKAGVTLRGLQTIW